MEDANGRGVNTLEGVIATILTILAGVLWSVDVYLTVVLLTVALLLAIPDSDRE